MIMIENDKQFESLPNLLDYFQKHGTLCFTKREIAPIMDISEAALNLTLHRQIVKNGSSESARISTSSSLSNIKTWARHHPNGL